MSPPIPPTPKTRKHNTKKDGDSGLTPGSTIGGKTDKAGKTSTLGKIGNVGLVVGSVVGGIILIPKAIGSGWASMTGLPEESMYIGSCCSSICCFFASIAMMFMFAQNMTGNVNLG